MKDAISRENLKSKVENIKDCVMIINLSLEIFVLVIEKLEAENTKLKELLEIHQERENC